MKFILILLIPFNVQGQFVYSGLVISKTTKEQIPYATVALMKANTGTNANEKGEFRLAAKSNALDTLLISSVGFETFKISTNQFSPGMTFDLVAKEPLLKPVFLVNVFKRVAILNDYANCGINSYTSSGAVTQIAQHFKALTKLSLLSEIHICKTAGNAIFRIRIYDLDTSTGKPGMDLLDTVLEIRSRKRDIDINLETYKIRIPNKEFFIAVQWLYIEENKQVSTYKLNGKKHSYFQYSPYIFFKEPKASSSLNVEENLQNWQLEYRDTWIQIPPAYRFLISAVMKY